MMAALGLSHTATCRTRPIGPAPGGRLPPAPRLPPDRRPAADPGGRGPEPDRRHPTASLPLPAKHYSVASLALVGRRSNCAGAALPKRRPCPTDAGAPPSQIRREQAIARRNTGAARVCKIFTNGVGRPRQRTGQHLGWADGSPSITNRSSDSRMPRHAQSPKTLGAARCGHADPQNASATSSMRCLRRPHRATTSAPVQASKGPGRTRKGHSTRQSPMCWKLPPGQPERRPG